MRVQKKTRISIVLGIVTILAIGGTTAYFLTTESAHNVISTSGVDVELYELADPTGDGSTLIPFSNLVNVFPGSIYSKIPYIENIDTEPVWVRAKLTLTRTTTDGTVTPINDIASVIELGDVGTNWMTGEDGYYYYNLSLNAGEATEPIFKTVKFTDELPNSLQGVTFSLIINAEATQMKNNGVSATTASWTESGEEE